LTEWDLQLTRPEQGLLLHELNHRINNEFASVINAVSVAAGRSGNKQVKLALTGVTELLHRCADVNRALQAPEADTSIDAATYLRQVCFAISRFKLDHKKIRLVFAACPLQLRSVHSWRLGMIVHELITNAARHAFGDERGEIQVELLRMGSLVVCKVQDDGSSHQRVRRGRGLKIVEMLAETLCGRFEQKFGTRGSTSMVAFPYHVETNDRRSWTGRESRSIEILRSAQLDADPPAICRPANLLRHGRRTGINP
jgi:two-component sensor histidine kinase